MSNLIEHAKREFLAAGYKPIEKEEDGPDKWIQEAILELLELLEIFSKQGHSGSSAPYCISIFSKLASFEPLTPLTGKDDEWEKVTENMWQNKRCSHVFKDIDGKAYDIEGKVFREPNGVCYTNKNSHVYITFPYTPKREYVNVLSGAE